MFSFIFYYTLTLTLTQIESTRQVSSSFEAFKIILALLLLKFLKPLHEITE